jgi:hypothetical protein
MWCKLCDATEVKPSVGEHGKEHGMLSRGSAGRDAEVCLGFREVQDLGAIHIHGGAGLTGVEPSLVDLRDVGDDVGFRAARLTEELREPLEHIVIGN